MNGKTNKLIRAAVYKAYSGEEARARYQQAKKQWNLMSPRAKAIHRKSLKAVLTFTANDVQ